MILLSLITLLGAGAAALVAARLGGTLGAGVMAGYLLGAAMSGLGCLYQRHVLLTQPSKAMAAFAIAFLAKLAVVLMGAFSFRYIDAAAARADWQSFLVAFSAAVVLIVPLGAAEAARAAKSKKPGTKTPLKQAGV